MTDLIITKCDKKTAMSMADNALNHDGGWFYKTYGVLWSFKWFSSVIALFVWDEIKWMGSFAQSFDACKRYITVERIRKKYQSNNLPSDLWVGDTTVEMLINTFITAFVDNGYTSDDNEITTEDISGIQYTLIRGERCKLHLKKPYKGWDIYRAWNVIENHGKMKYFAVKDDDVLSARNLSGIKDAVSRVN